MSNYNVKDSLLEIEESNTNQMRSNLKVFEYEGKDITFDLGNGDVMVNATEMAKSFGKKPRNWLDLPSTTSFLEALVTVRKSDSDDFQAVTTVNGGTNPGTWMHEDVALEFARWLSMDFLMWCNARIKELLKHGGTAMDPEDLMDPDFIMKLATELKKERAEKRKVMEEKERVEKDLFEAAPKAVYTDEVLKREGLMSMTTIGQDYGLSARFLNRFMQWKGIHSGGLVHDGETY